MNRVYLIFREDITYYPPIFSVIKILQELKYQVFVLGEYSDFEQRKDLQKQGITFWQPFFVNKEKNPILRFFKLHIWKREIEKYLKQQHITNNDFIWIFQSETLVLFNHILDKYNVISHPLEFNNPQINWKYKLRYPFLNFDKLFSKAYKIVCCEYNRAHIFKGMYGLETLPIILPNKPYISSLDKIDVPLEISRFIESIIEKVRNKKIILYQGVFSNKERRLEEFCEAINNLPEEYVLVAMGKGSNLFDELKNKYESNRIIFIPFIRPPYHLLITQMCYIGVLSYFPRKNSMASVINPIYCAPNKIFEYSMFGKPMISNDIPGLKYIFSDYHCGQCIDYPLTPENIKGAILKIESDYQNFSIGATNYYNSINLKEIIKHILE